MKSELPPYSAFLASMHAGSSSGCCRRSTRNRRKPSWLPFSFGSFAGIIPWITIAIYVWAPGLNASPPGFVYSIIISLFVFFNCFAVNMILQYKKGGPWRDYLFGENVYIILSITAKALLAWQVFVPVLASTKF